MKAYIEGNLRIVENSSFKDAKTQESVPYFTNYVQDDEGKLSKIGSKQDYTAMVGRDCVFTVEVRSDYNKPNLFRLSIASVKNAG